MELLKRLHRHRYRIIGTGFHPLNNLVEVDLLCKCGKCGTVIVDDYFKDQIINQAANGKYFKVPESAIIAVGPIIHNS